MYNDDFKTFQENIMKEEIIRQEYSKRHLFIYNKKFTDRHEIALNCYDELFSKNLGDANFLSIFVQVLIRDIRRYNFIDGKKSPTNYAISISGNIQDSASYFVLSTCNSYEQILIAELECIEKYHTYLFSMIKAYNICDILKSFIDGDPLVLPTSKIFLEKENYFYNQMYTAVTEYGHYAGKYEMTDIQKDYQNYLRENFSHEKALLFEMVCTLRNNHDLESDFIQLVMKELATKMSKNFRPHTFHERLKGLLYYDYVTTCKCLKKKYKVNDFLQFLGENELEEKRKFYQDKTKRKYNDYLKIASLSIYKNSIQNTRAKGNKEIPDSPDIHQNFTQYISKITKFIEEKSTLLF